MSLNVTQTLSRILQAIRAIYQMLCCGTDVADLICATATYPLSFERNLSWGVPIWSIFI